MTEEEKIDGTAAKERKRIQKLQTRKPQTGVGREQRTLEQARSRHDVPPVPAHLRRATRETAMSRAVQAVEQRQEEDRARAA